MFYRTRGRGWMALAAGAAVLVTRGMGVEPEDVLIYSVGPMQLRPQLGAGEIYDDNIFYREQDTISDFITRLTPGLNAQLGRRAENHLFFSYTYDHAFYLDNAFLNSGDHLFALTTHLEGARLSLDGIDRVQLLSGLIGAGTTLGQIAGTELLVTDPETGQVVGGGTISPDQTAGQIISLNLGRKLERTSYSDNYTLEYTISDKTAVHLNGAFDAIDYARGAPLFDFNALRGTAGFTYLAFPKTGFFGEFYYGQTAVTPNDKRPKPPHVEFMGGFVGAKGFFTPRLSGLLKAGYELRDFPGRFESSDGPVAEGSLDYAYSERTLARISYARRTGVSIESSGETFTSDTLSAGVSQTIGAAGKLIASLGGGLSLDEYEIPGTRANRQNRWYRINFDLTYRIQLWLLATLGYQFEKLDSSGQGTIDYEVNRVTVRVIVGY